MHEEIKGTVRARTHGDGHGLSLPGGAQKARAGLWTVQAVIMITSLHCIVFLTFPFIPNGPVWWCDEVDVEDVLIRWRERIAFRGR